MWLGASQHLPAIGWSHTVRSHCPISLLPWRICRSHQAVYKTSLWHAFLCAAAVWTSSVSEFKMPSMDEVSSSSELLLSLVFPKRMTSGETEQYRSGPSESPPDDPVSDSDLVVLEVTKLNTLESEVCGLGLDPRGQWLGDGDWLREYDGLCGE